MAIDLEKLLRDSRARIAAQNRIRDNNLMMDQEYNKALMPVPGAYTPLGPNDMTIGPQMLQSDYMSNLAGQNALTDPMAIKYSGVLNKTPESYMVPGVDMPNQIEQSYPPNIKDLMRTDGIPVPGYEEMYGQVPGGGIGGGSVAGLSPWHGTPMGTSSYDPSIYGSTQSAMGDTRVADPSAYEPEYAGERLLPSAHEPGIASLLDVSPEQRRAMQEQIGGPGFHSPPTFAATNHAQMGPLSSVTLGQSDPNFHAPEFTRSDKPGGLLTEQSSNTGDESGWDKDERWGNASNRKNRWQELVGMGLLNMSNNMMRENTF